MKLFTATAIAVLLLVPTVSAQSYKTAAERFSESRIDADLGSRTDARNHRETRSARETVERHNTYRPDSFEDGPMDMDEEEPELSAGPRATSPTPRFDDGGMEEEELQMIFSSRRGRLTYQ